MINYVTGDLFDPAHNFDAVAHGCNCAGAMGGGIARVFGERYPEMRDNYATACRRDVYGLKPGDIYPWIFNQSEDEPFLVVYNLMTQLNPGSDARINAIRTSVRKMLIHAHKQGYVHIGLPRIGAGIGGLKWDDVEDAIEWSLYPFEHSHGITVVTRKEDKHLFDD
jgi:O-acetyl-ADP-ribose deacetylase (regulator of RNase III)